MVISATFEKSRIQDSGSDSVMDYRVYVFKDIVDEAGIKHNSKWFKTTKLLEKVNFNSGKKYTIKLSSPIHSGVNMPYPVSILDGKTEYYKHGGLIKQRDSKGLEKTLTIVDKLPAEFERAAIMKLMDQKMDEGYLLRKNLKGSFFKIIYEGKGDVVKYQRSDLEENYVTITKNSKEEIERCKKSVLVTLGGLSKHFVIKTQLSK